MAIRIPKTWGERLGWILAAFLIGIAFHSIQPFVIIPPYVFGATAGVLLLCTWTFWDRPYEGFVCLLLLFTVIGVWRFDASIPRPMDGLLPWRGQMVRMTGIVLTSAPSGKRISATINVHTAGGLNVTGLGSKLLVYVSKDDVASGSSVSFFCKPRLPTTFSSSMNRRASLARRGIWNECSSTISLVEKAAPRPWDIPARLTGYRRALTARIKLLFPSDEAELIAGILYGDEHLGATLRMDVQRAGLMHLVAVSGSNVTIVVTIVAVILLSLGLGRSQAFWVTTIMLIIFTIFVGASASVLRAAVMGWLILAAREIGRKAWPDRLLLVAAAILSAYDPWVLCYDAGFALSFLATWGLISWSPIIEARIKWMPRTLGLRATAATTFAATLMITPYAAWLFGQMTLAGLLTNLLALPLVPWTMLWGAAAVAIGSAPFSVVFRLPALGLAHSIIEIARLSRLATWLDLQIHGLNIWFLGAAYLLIWWLWRLLSMSEKRPIFENEAVDRAVRML